MAAAQGWRVETQDAIVYLTGGILLANVILATVTAFLWKATSKQASATTDAAEATQKQAELATRSLEAAERQAELARDSLGATLRAAEATEAQATLARDALEASAAPLLVDVPTRTKVPNRRLRFPQDTTKWDVGEAHVVVANSEEDRERILVSLLVRNAGPGTALIQGTSLVVARHPVRYHQAIERAVLPPDEMTAVSFTLYDPDFPELRQRIRQGGDFSVVVSYSDALGRQRRRTRFDIYQQPDRQGPHRVRQLFFFRGDEQDAYAASGPADIPDF